MKAVMLCETCGEPIFYDESWHDFACQKCGEVYEEWTEEDTELIMEGIKIFTEILPWALLNRKRDGKEDE